MGSRPIVRILAACGLAVATLAGGRAAAGVPFSNPPAIASANGVLETTLTVQPAALKVAGKQVAFPALTTASTRRRCCACSRATWSGSC